MACHQVPLDDNDKAKTGLSTPMGALFQFMTMPFGNAPVTFQRIAERALEGLQWHIAAYTIVYSSSIENHLRDLERVMERLQMGGLKLKTKKCCFFRHEISFLGYLVSEDGLKPDPVKWIQCSISQDCSP